jgi:hypothetical protein
MADAPSIFCAIILRLHFLISSGVTSSRDAVYGPLRANISETSLVPLINEQ